MTTSSASPAENTLARSLQPFVVGGCSAMLASSCIHPIDLSKVRLQLFAQLNPGVPKPSYVGILTTMVKNDGFLSIYSGLSASLMRQAVYGTARIGLHRSFSETLVKQNNGQPISFGMKTMAGMAAGAIAVTIGTPFDVSLVRMQADSMKEPSKRRGYKHVFDAIVRIVREEGFGRLYSGVVPNIMRGMAMNVGMLACYDQAQEFVSKEVFHDHEKTPSLETQLLASLIAGFTASAFSLPFDLLKSRIQDGSNPATGVVSAAMQVLRKEGFLAFWTGFSAYYLRTAPHSMIILMSQQPITRLYQSAFDTHN